MELTKKSSIIKTVEDFQKLNDYLNLLDDDINALFNLSHSRIRFGAGTDGSRGENISGTFQVFTSNAVADTEDTIAHGIGAVPIGFIVVNRDKAGTLYDGGTAWTSTNMYLKSSVAETTYTIFVLK
jgi:hypothetical protein